MDDPLPTVHVDRPLTPDDVELVDARARIVGPHDDTLHTAVAAVIGVGHQWNAERFARFSELRVVSRMGIGYDNIDLDAATAAGVVICNAPDAPTVSTAEHTIALMLAITKELPVLQHRANAGQRGTAQPTALELDGATLGLLGLGRIGRRVAVAGLALGMRVIAHDPVVDDAPAGVELVGLDDVIETSDVISLHAPALPETHHVIDAAALERAKRGVYIVNCARGSLVDQAALLAALDAGHVAGAALDVTDPEPLPVGHPLLDRPDVIVTPHVASATAAGRQRLFARAFENALAVLDGRPASVVNPPVV